MTAEDVKFAMDYTMNPRNGARGFALLNLVERVDAVDPHTINVYLKQVSAAFLAMLTDIQAFSVIPKDSLEEAVDKPARFPPGTGPFKFVEWQPRQHILLERHADYWGQKAFVDKLVLRPIEDATIRITALRAGDVDLIERAPYEWAREILDGKMRGIGFVEAPYAGYRQIRFNVAGSPFESKRLRHAVAHAIDKQELVDAVYFGFGAPADQKYPKGQAWYMDGVPTLTYNPDRARALLREIGYNDEPIEILSETTSDVQAATTVIQAQLKRVGINARIVTLENNAYRALIQQGSFAFLFGGSDFKLDPSSTYSAELHCEPDLKKRASNSSGYCDPEMDALLERAETELDEAQRRALVKQIVTRKSDDIPQLPIMFVPRFFAFRDYVKGFTSDADGSFRWFHGGLNYTWLDK
jgi:ABC-type transport system substrate-binding protein